MDAVAQVWFAFIHGPLPQVETVVRLGALAFVLLLVISNRRSRPSAWLRLAAVGVLGGLALALIYRRAWIADDAFISFRYARNLASGFGLIWNRGELTEGYTNFLWTCVLAVGESLEIQSAYLAITMNVASVLTFLCFFVWRWRGGSEFLEIVLPALLVFSPGFIEFGTSGLESAPVALVSVAAVYLASNRKSGSAVALALIAAFLRPDHVLVLVAIASLGAIRRDRRLLWYAFVAAFCFGVYWIARWQYYRSFFPNTFYAKSAGESYWSQGIVYVVEALLSSGHLPTILLLFVVSMRGLDGLTSDGRARALSSIAAAVLLGGYVVKVGGDFMEHRFWLTPGALMLLSSLSILVEVRWAGVRILPFVLASASYAPDLIAPGEKRWQIARESSFYHIQSMSPLVIDSPYFRIANAVAASGIADSEQEMLSAGCVGMIGYLGGGRVYDTYGLVSSVGRKRIESRGRPGHEKRASLQEIFESGATWSIDPPEGSPLIDPTRFEIGGVPVWAIRYSPAVARRLGGAYPQIGAVLASALDAKAAAQAHAAMSTFLLNEPVALRSWREKWNLLSVDRLETDGHVISVLQLIRGTGSISISVEGCPGGDELVWETAGGECSPAVLCGNNGLRSKCVGTSVTLSEFRVRQSSRERRVAWAKARGAAALAQVLWEEFELGGEAPLRRFSFEKSEPQEGDMTPGVFGVTRGAVEHQQAIEGYRGSALLNSFVNGDVPRGEWMLRVPLIVGQRYLVSGLVGGGADCTTVGVSIEASGNGIGVACGGGDERLRSFGFEFVAPSSDVVIRVFDRSSGPWGHVLVDDLAVWALKD